MPTGNGDVRRQARSLGSDRVLGDLDEDFLPNFEQLLDARGLTALEPLVVTAARRAFALLAWGALAVAQAAIAARIRLGGRGGLGRRSRLGGRGGDGRFQARGCAHLLHGTRLQRIPVSGRVARGCDGRWLLERDRGRSA